jgi:hypothetical protein
MKKLGLLIVLGLIKITFIEGQEVRIIGKLADKEGGKQISWGFVTLNPGNQVAIVSENGEFSFTCLPGEKQIRTQVVGYKKLFLQFYAKSDTSINVNLDRLLYELNEVVITGDSLNQLQFTSRGNIIINPASIRETPRLFSEPDLLKSFQLLPGVLSGREGTSDIYVRGGGVGQNIIQANGCSFFLPSHLLGFISPYDLDFIERAELFKDYIPAELGGGASSVISLDFKENRSDSLRAQLRFGLLSSGILLELPYERNAFNLTLGLRRGNYSLYAPLLKKIVSQDVSDFLPPNKYSFYDGFINLSRSSPKLGKIDYLFFGNYDREKEETLINYQLEDTLTNYKDLFSSGWNSMVHAISWRLPEKNDLHWQLNLNYNRLSTGRNLFKEIKTLMGIMELSESSKYIFSPILNTFGSTLLVTKNIDKSVFSAGITQNLRVFNPNIRADYKRNDTLTVTKFGESSRIYSVSVFGSSTFRLDNKIQFDLGLRLSGGFFDKTHFLVPEPRLRLSWNNEGELSPHINYIRLSQFDHSIEGSNTGLRSMLWIPMTRNFGPEISDIISAGVRGNSRFNFVWSIDAYYKKIKGMLDYKPGASFIFDSTFVDILNTVNGSAYGLETGIMKNLGNFTFSFSYTYSRSQINWSTPAGLVWIPANSDRPHNLNLVLRWHFKEKSSFGLNWVYYSGAPATIYMHTTSYGELLDTKNNIRYFNYHRLDLSYRRIIYKRKYTIFLDLDVYNVYNRKNTFYFKEAYDTIEQRYYYKNISLFPIMPSLSLTIAI